MELLAHRVVESTLRHHYVDNLLDCFGSEEEALQTTRPIRAIHNKVGFNIRNWIYNSELVFREMNEKSTNPLTEVDMDMFYEMPIERVLEMYASTVEDE